MMTVHEVAALAGVSERTLRYYDRLGLLPPEMLSPAGYRLYGDADLRRLQQILFLRELEFPLKEIQPILEAEAMDRKQAVRQHRELLRLKKKRLQGLIDLCDRLLEGADDMSLNEFNQTELDNQRDAYADEVKQRWGETDAYRESRKRTDAYHKEDWAVIKAESDAILSDFAALVGHSPVSPEVRAVLDRWCAHITKRYYPMTEEILAGLGQMYVADDRFRATLDGFGAGTAELISQAIRRKGE